MKIKMSEVNQMIKEEFQKMLVKKKLSTRLSQINEELSHMNEEDANLSEVEAGGLEKTKSATGLVPGEQHTVKFEKIGSSLKEDDIEGIEGSEISEEKPMGEFEAKFAEIGKAIDAKMAAEMGGASVGSTEEIGAGEPDADDFEEVEVSNEPGIEGAEGSEGAEDTEEKEVDEYAEVVGGEGAPQHGMTAADATKSVNGEKEEVKESVDEPLEGHSVAQEVSADKVNDNMEKDTHVKEGEKKEGSVITESTKPASKNIFTEGVDDKKKAAMLNEMNRMKKFAGLSKDEE